MDAQQLQDYLQGFQDELADLRNSRNVIELVNDLHAQTVEQQVAGCEVEYQNNLPGVLPTVAPISLFEDFHQR
ncbi:MAG: hypothetical protein GY861_10560 [bacterium]|nr:hypothetical protein [bacterium]